MWGFTGARGHHPLAHTYANSYPASERLFWALAAHLGLTVIGADIANAFAEAPPPEAPLYMYIDDAYREWWEHHLHLDPIPQECTVVQVFHAIQGHPESPHLWEKHIHAILRGIPLQPTTHEPCLYHGIVAGHLLLLLQQVDDLLVHVRIPRLQRV